MNVVYVYHGQWPKNATRIRKQTQSLAAAGHAVTLASANPDGRQSDSETGWMAVRPMPAAPGGLHRLANAPLPFNPFWASHVRRVARSAGADALVVRDLPLAPTALGVGARLGIPVHYDMADIYPLFLGSSRSRNPLKQMLRRPQAALALERWVLDRAQSVGVVSEESRDRLLARGVPADRIVLVGNTPEDPDALVGDHAVPHDVEDWAGDAILLFIGNLLDDRGVDVAIDAVDAAGSTHPSLRLVVIGDGPELPGLRAMVAKRGLEERVRLLGWKAHDALPPYYAAAKAGLLPFVATPHTKVTLANKLFDYMAARLPVIASDVPPMRRIIEEADCGHLFRPHDTEDLRRVLVEVAGDWSGAALLGLHGRTAVENRYNWAADGGRFVERIELLVAQGGRVKPSA